VRKGPIELAGERPVGEFDRLGVVGGEGMSRKVNWE